MWIATTNYFLAPKRSEEIMRWECANWSGQSENQNSFQRTLNLLKTLNVNVLKTNKQTRGWSVGVVLPLSRGWLRLCAKGSGPRRSSRWFKTLPRWPVCRRLPTVKLCRYTGSTRWLSSAPCRPRTFHLGEGGRRQDGEEVKGAAAVKHKGAKKKTK